MDDPLSMYLPEWGETKVFAGGTADEPLLVEQERPITIKHLLTHTSGMNTIVGRPEVNKMGARAMKAYATEHGGIQVIPPIGAEGLDRRPPAGACRLFLGPGFRLAARWNRLGQAVKAHKKREKTGQKWARYGLNV